MESAEQCVWCGKGLAAGDGWWAEEPAESRYAAFCRLEHLVPWMMKGPKWRPGSAPDGAGQGELADAGERPYRCAECGVELGEAHTVLTRHRGEFRITDRFCNADHMVAWAKAGGRWR